MKPQEPHPELLTTEQVEQLLQLSARSVYDLRLKGKLPFIKISKRCFRYPRAALLRSFGLTEFKS